VLVKGPLRLGQLVTGRRRVVRGRGHRLIPRRWMAPGQAAFVAAPTLVPACSGLRHRPPIAGRPTVVGSPPRSRELPTSPLAGRALWHYPVRP
jgi:hypothetical protein